MNKTWINITWSLPPVHWPY